MRNKAGKYKYQCLQCGFKSNRKYNYEVHMQSKKHNNYHKLPIVHVCDCCNYSTKYKSNLVKHKKSIKHQFNAQN